MSHYVPASLDNVTEVVEYVLAIENRLEMSMIVDSANRWCKRTMSRERLARDAMSQLRKYRNALDENYGDGWEEEWIDVRGRIMSNVGGDLVDCSG